ncbi:MAG: sulfite exporter TauE/SafE family protein [Nitrososphaerales archaeon]|nr:sulfite exporter TauE/SafE family protein [Nitrososphaerales archaeon]
MLILIFLIGVFAEFIDNSLGMAYGVTSNSFLLSLGLLPAISSAIVHMSEIGTSAVAGISHLKFGNVDKEIFKKLVIPGPIFAALGAYVVVNAPTEIIKPLVAIYLLTMGVIILLKSKNINIFLRRVNIPILAAIGGFVDAIGGGGWGPVVTSTLIANGNNPRKVIGSVNASEFVVTIIESIIFILTLNFLGVYWPVVLALLLGGAIIAPLSAYFVKRLPIKTMLVLVGGLVIILSLRNLYYLFT